MNRRFRFFAVFVALALMAGPVAAACSDCCPKTEGPAALAPAEGCCGDCEPSVESSPERPSASLRAAVSVPQPAAGSGAPSDASIAPSVLSSPVTTLGVRSLAFAPPRTLSPLRL